MSEFLKLFVALIALSLPFGGTAGAQPPTIEEYVAAVGNKAKIVPAGKLTIEGKRLTCEHSPTAIDPGFDDFAGAYPGFLILNLEKMRPLPKAVQWWIFAHVCVLALRGPDSDRADCVAVQRGRQEGWLSQRGMDQICKYIGPAKGTDKHSPGPARCQRMRSCYDS